MDHEFDSSSIFEPFQEFLDPIHDFIHYTEQEISVIDHPAFQRLFNIHQLGQTNLVFRGATHRRGEHALGAVAAAEKLAAAINRSYRKHQQDRRQLSKTNQAQTEWKSAKGLNKVEIAFLRLATLLHDIGHVVAGHTLEDELGLLSPHDSDRRLDFVFDRKTWGGVHISDNSIPNGEPLWLNETLRQRIDRVYAHLFEQAGITITHDSNVSGQRRLFEEISVQPTEVLLQIISEDRKADLESLRYKCLPSEDPIRVAVIHDIVSDTVCADLIDYLLRDWKHIGKARQLDTRLLQYMEIRESDRTGKTHLIVNLESDSEPGYRSDVVSAILELLENRYHLWEVALLHKTKTAAGAMLERAIAEHLDDAKMLHYQQNPSLHPTPEDLLLQRIFEASDLDIFDSLERGFRPRASGAESESTTTELSVASRLFWRLRHRVLHKQMSRVSYGPYAHRISEFLAPKDASPELRIEAAKNRLSSLRILENDFELEPGDLAMHIVPLDLGKKLAKIRVYYAGEVMEFNQLDQHQESNVSGGHLRAQLMRFDQLWRASLFIAPEKREKLARDGLLDLLAVTFRLAVLRIGRDDWTLHRVASELKDRMTMQYTKDRTLLSEEQRAAIGFSEDVTYPSAQPTLRSYFS